MFDTNYSEKLVAAASEKSKEKEYWLNKLSGEIEKTTFPCDYRRKSPYKRCMEPFQFELTGETLSKLIRLTNNNDQSLYIVLTAGLVALLKKYTGKKDIIIGTPILKQNIKRKFINKLLVLRTLLEENLTFKELILQMKQTILEAIEHRNYPIQILLKDLGLTDPEPGDDFPLFDIVVLLENIHDKTDIQPINTNIIFSFLKSAGYIDGQLEFNRLFYRRETIERIIAHFKLTLERSLLRLESKLSGIEILTEEEKTQILYEFNHTTAEYPRESTIQQLFEEQTIKKPDHVALVGTSKNMSDTVSKVSVTYKELNKRSNQLASLLRKKGVKPNTIVGLMINRTIEMIINIMGILKGGSAYLPINTDFPANRITSMVEDANVSILLTDSQIVNRYSFTRLQGLQSNGIEPQTTAPRSLNKDFAGLPLVDRSLIHNEKYNQFIGHGMVKNSITLQATRGCPYDCAFCCRVWPRKLVVRSGENIFSEVKMYYDLGIRRFVFIDDIFNFDIKNSRRFFELVIKNNLDIHILFPSGLRGDILTKEYIDLMIQAGTISFPLSLETASPRLQKLIKKNLNLKKFGENIEYIIEKYPHVILELNTMHGLPTETEDEARMTLDFIKNLKYLHFPYVHILRIHSNTFMEKLALENGISINAIQRSRDLFYHELPDTLPFDKSFTLKYQAEFFNEYFLSKDRLLHVLPYQMKTLTEDEIVQKYNSYLPTPIHSFSDLLEFVNIKREELPVKSFVDENQFYVPNLDEKMRKRFPAVPPSRDALRVLLLDLSQFYSHEREMLYDVVEQPLGLMYLLSYLNQQFGEKIYGKIAKSRIDFDGDEQLRQLLKTFNPDVIGVRTLTMYRDFFHKSIAKIRQWGFKGLVIAGGPYATVDYNTLLHDRNIDLAVLGEGELTFGELIARIMENEGQLPGEEVIKTIAGLAFIPQLKSRATQGARKIFMADSLREILPLEPGSNPAYISQSSDLAYIAYTSGSTGKPKGVMVEHKNVGRLVKNTNYIDIKPPDNILQLSNYAFDGSVFDIYGALLNGSKLVMIKEEDLLDVDKLSTLIRSETITVFFVTTALFNVLIDTHIECFDSIRHVLFGGERVSFDHVEKAFRHMKSDRIIHVYGPTETTVYATYHPITRLDKRLGTIPIGKPLSNTTVYILARDMTPVPIGVSGEIFIGGDSVARGYLNRQELTREKFVPDPFAKIGRLYRTGDLARWHLQGNIEFLGRIDKQVKLRGFRIELGEIETSLLKIGGIKEAVVAVREERNGDKCLCAYVIAESNELSIDFLEIKKKLSLYLPDFMIPSYFVQLEKIPLNSNGKINRKALPAPKIDIGEDYIAPRDEIERKLVEIWAEVLNVNKDVISIHSNFFELGGHSLKATILISKLHKAFHVKIPLVELFRTSTIRELAQNITGLTRDEFSSIAVAEKKEYYRLSSAQKRLYILQQLDPANPVYNMVDVVHLNKDTDTGKVENTFLKLMNRHESFRTSFKMVNEEPVQVVHDDVKFEIQYFFTKHSPEDREVEEITDNFVRPFDLSNAPLLRVGLLIAKGNIILLVDMHHIISDGTSREVLIDEFQDIYNGKDLSGLKLQYKDYAQWLNRKEQLEKMKEQEAYYLKIFSGDLPVLKLPTDYPRPPLQSFEGKAVCFELTQTETGKIKKIVKETDTTLFMVILSIYYILLSKLSSQEDIIVGIPIAGRRHADLQSIVGMFVNTLALRNFPSGDKTVKEFIAEVKTRTLEAFENQEYPFEELVEKTVAQRDPSRNPLFDVMFNLLNQTEYTKHISYEKQSEKEEYVHQKGKSSFDMILVGTGFGENLSFRLVYCTKLFKPETIEQFIKYFRNILSGLDKGIQQKIEELEIVPEAERDRVLSIIARDETEISIELDILG